MSLPSKYQTLLTNLRNLGVDGVNDYEERLMDNSANPDKLQDFFEEGIAALTLDVNGFGVVISEKPDLIVKFEGCEFNAEVKHFRFKKQDIIDDIRMSTKNDFAVYGDTEPTEGKKAWCQVYDVLDKKDKVLPADKPGIIVLASSSIHCVESSEVMFAVNKMREEIFKKVREISSFNGVLFFGQWYVHQDDRDTYYFDIEKANPRLPANVLKVLENIKSSATIQ